MYICKCGSKKFECALEPVTKPLIAGIPPKKGRFYTRCSNKYCHLPIAEALELKAKCPECEGEAFRSIGPTEIGSVIKGKMYLDTKVMVVECLKCGEKFGEDYLEEQAELRVYNDGFVLH